MSNFRLKADGAEKLRVKKLLESANEPLFDKHTFNKIGELCGYSKRNKSAGRSNRRVIAEILDEGRPEFLKVHKSSKQPIFLTQAIKRSTTARAQYLFHTHRTHRPASQLRSNSRQKVVSLRVRKAQREVARARESKTLGEGSCEGAVHGAEERGGDGW
eukprot:TRINITY_DN1971_c0_g5_i1.p3 TRINITY_DN1971_c0_g5~~TRINITY_DN1971_c0_g5_i1.p3  ORF type:complete len:159 (+),score=36.00 TRINITY_DN1971_c0_g5_i1:651-1127(+)